MLAQFVIHARGRQAVRNSLANEMAELREEQLAGDAKKLARTKWLHANGAEASFPCGVVHFEDEAVPVLVAIVPDGIAFLAETPPGASTYDVLEVGRIPQSGLTEVDVVEYPDSGKMAVAAGIPERRLQGEQRTKEQRR